MFYNTGYEIKETCSTTVVLRKTLISTHLCPLQHSSWKTFIIYMPGLDKKTYVLQAGMFWEKRYSIYKTNFDKNIILYNPGFEKKCYTLKLWISEMTHAIQFSCYIKLLFSKTRIVRKTSRSNIGFQKFFMRFTNLVLRKTSCSTALLLKIVSTTLVSGKIL